MHASSIETSVFNVSDSQMAFDPATSSVISENKVFDNVDDFLQHLSASQAATTTTIQQQQQQQERVTSGQKRRAPSENTSKTPSVEVEERILEKVIRSRNNNKTVNATFSQYVHAVLDIRDEEATKRARGAIFRILSE